MSSTPRNVAVLINGNARGVTERVVKLVSSVVPPEHLFISRSLTESRAIAKKLLLDRYDAVLTGGGDGTFVQFVSQLHELLDPLAPGPAEKTGRPASQPGRPASVPGRPVSHPGRANARGVTPPFAMPAVGVLKLGTGNAMGVLLGASDPTEEGLTADYWKARYVAGFREMRFIEVEGRVAPFSGVGMDALILNDYIFVKDRTRGTALEQHLTGGMGYATAIGLLSLPKIATLKMPRIRIVNEGAPAWRVGADGRRVGPLVLQGETLYEGVCQIASVSRLDGFGYNFRLFPFAYVREDRVHLRVATTGAFEVLKNLHLIWRGEYFSDQINDFLVDRIAIYADSPMPFQIGGDGEGRRSFVRMALAKEPLRLLDYRTAPSVLPIGPTSSRRPGRSWPPPPSEAGVRPRRASEPRL